MKLLDHFTTFLQDHVDLNQTRVTQLENSIEAVEAAIRDSTWGAEIVEFVPQGSWAHGTIIKPLPDNPFDADLIAIVKPKQGWEAKDYVNKLATALEATPTYKDKVRRYSHCATIEYAGERKIDIAPCVQDRERAGTYEVCNRNSNEFEASAPIAYTSWVVGKNAIAGGNDLKKVTRLLKYLRDIKTNFTCPSFLLTTLIGYRINDSDKDSKALVDTPTALKTLVGRLDDWLQANPQLPEVRNPVLASEVQSSVWDETQYGNFRDKINLYRGWIDDAYGEEDRDESIGKWRRVFGDSFAAGEAKESARLSEAAAKGDNAIAAPGLFKDLVEQVKTYGAKMIPSRLTRLPYVERPKWRAASTSLIVKISAALYGERYGTRMRTLQSGEPLQKGFSILFGAVNNAGGPFPTDYLVKWRVTNTDEAAYAAGQLRGDFYDSDNKEAMTRWESLAYRGVHFVEAFLIRKSDKRLMGKSEPFFVVIE